MLRGQILTGMMLRRQMSPRQLPTHTDGLWGGVKIENRENLGQFPNRGGEGKKNQKCPNFNLGILKTEGGVSFFQECPNFNLGILKTEGGSLFFKNVPISVI